MPIDYKRYLSSINQSTIENGEKYFNEKKYTKAKLDLNGPIKLISIICNNYVVKVEFTENKIFSHNCQCIIGRNGVICKHVVCAVLEYLNAIEDKHSNQFVKKITKFEIDPNVLTLINSIYSAQRIACLDIKPSKIDLIEYDKKIISELKENTNAIKDAFKKWIEPDSVTKKIDNDFVLVQNKLDAILALDEFIKAPNVKKLITLLELLEKAQNLFEFNINNTRYNLNFSHKPDNNIDVYITKTSIAYLLSSNVQDFAIYSLGDDIFNFLVLNINEIVWFNTVWDPEYKSNIISQLDYRTKSLSSLWERIEEIKESPYIKPIFHGLDLVEKQNSLVEFYYDYDQQKAVLRICNDKKIIRNYLSKYSCSFIKKENDNFLYTNSLKEIKDINKALKEMSSDKEIVIKVAKEFLNRKKYNIKYNFILNNGKMLKLKIDSELDSKSLKKLYQSYLKGEKFVYLNKELYDIESFDFAKFQEDMNDIGIKESDYNNFNYDIDHREIFYLNSKFFDNEIKEMINQINQKIDNNYFLKDIDTSTLKPYQTYGINWMISTLNLANGCILADEMGLGKTIQAIYLLKYFYLNKTKVKPTLLIVPLTLIWNWKAEFKKFYPEKELIEIIGPAEKRQKIIQNIKSDNIYITTYNLIKNDIKQLKHHEFLNVILDEGHYIKNFSTQWTKEIKKINSTNKLILSGTPIENNLLELWSIFDFIIPGYLWTLGEFKRRYMKKINEHDLYNLSLKIKPFILQRFKEQHLELPDKIVNNIYLEMEKDERQAYDNLLNITKEEVSKLNPNKKNKIEILSLITKLRQFCCSPKLIGINDVSETKVDFCIEFIQEIIDENPDSKVVLFSNFSSILDILKEKLSNKSFNTLSLTGKNNVLERKEIIEQFKNNVNDKVLLISLKIGGVGLNLTFANNVIIYNPWWNESAELQAVDRLHRIGQQQSVNIHKFIYKNSIEHNIALLKKDKIDIIEKAINNLKYEDLLKLLDEKNNEE